MLGSFASEVSTTFMATMLAVGYHCLYTVATTPNAMRTASIERRFKTTPEAGLTGVVAGLATSGGATIVVVMGFLRGDLLP